MLCGQSRLGAMLSYLSPFRSTRKVKQPTPEPEPEESDEGEEEPLEAEQDDDDDEEQGQFALHGQSLAHVGENAYGEHEVSSLLWYSRSAELFLNPYPSSLQLEGRAPPSPTPHTYSTANLYPNLNLAASLSASQSLPDLSFANSTPRFSSNHAAVPSPLGRAATPSAYADSEAGAARSPPGRATEELARFFRDKADRGDEPLSAIEQAGVFALMQQGELHGARWRKNVGADPGSRWQLKPNPSQRPSPLASTVGARLRLHRT